MECKYCKNLFSSKANLNNHQKTAKYCLKVRKISVEQSYNCLECKKQFTRAHHLNRHQENCRPNKYVSNLQNDINKLKEKISNNQILIQQKDELLLKYEVIIKELQNKLENVAIKAVSRPTTTKTQINNYIQQLQPVTDQIFIDNAPNLTIDHILKGPEGYAQYALEYPLKDRMICVDYARRKVKFKDKNGNVITDPEMTQLTTKFFNSIKDKNKELIFQYGNELKERFGDEMDTIVEILDYKMAVDKGSEGERSDLHHDFVKQMCSQTLRD